jgi:alkylation response protein AidB-like acyl-CoA dehydrogenase
MDIWKSTLARLFRDSRLGPIGGGTSEILKEILSK